MSQQQMYVSALQMNSKASVTENLALVAAGLAELPPERPRIVVLPEAFSCFGAGDLAQLQQAEPAGLAAPVQQQLSQLARTHEIYLVAGTQPLQVPEQPDKFSASCMVYDPSGEQIARYDKMHLFDVEVADSTRTYHESKYTQAGQQVVSFATEFGRVGLAVCYDVRFPELFRALREQGCELLLLPAAFTQVTGAAHWHTLLRARAIEQQCWLVAAAQVGVHANGRETYGHSLIVDAWGTVVAERAQGTGWVHGCVDRDQIATIRRNIPVAQHNQFQVLAKSPSTSSSS